MSLFGDAAAKYAARGIPVFPIKPGSKAPLIDGGFHAATTDQDTIAGWWDRVPDANIGTSPGATNRVAIDIDPRNDGTESYARLEELYGKIETAEVQTGGGGTHSWLGLPEGVTIRSRSNAFGPDFPGVDVKSTGGYVVLPPSVHPCGEPYCWDAGNRPIAEIPSTWLQALIDSDDAGKRLAPQLGEGELEIIPEGERDSTLASIAGTMRRRGMDAAEIYAAIVAVNARRCKPPLPESDLDRIARSVARYTPGDPIGAKSEPQPAGDPAGKRISLTDWNAVRIERVVWLMLNRIPFAELTIIEGPGGLGKTTALLDVGARLTRGAAMPDGTPTVIARDIVLVAEEDRVSILKARLQAAGADLSRVHHISTVDGGRFSLPMHGSVLHELVVAVTARFVLLDAIFNHIDAGLRTDKAEDVRRMLVPLTEMAHLTGAAVTGIRHWGKTARSATSRGLGSADIANISRSVISVGRHPSDDQMRVMAVAKSNLGLDIATRSLSFTIESVTIADDVNGDSVDVGHIRWGDEVEVTAEDLANGVEESGENRSRVAEAAEQIRELLTDGPRPAAEIRGALKAAGIHDRLVFRAMRKANVIAETDPGSFPRTKTWSLPHARTRTRDCEKAVIYSITGTSTAADTTDTTDTFTHKGSGVRTGSPGDIWTKDSLLCSVCGKFGLVRTSDGACQRCVGKVAS